ncbi:hypothetical protein RG384_002212 [Acinetobacter baumannii]|uniref:hypothetical protein n=1 Tax=Acinetobacter baumannii TaxID=470 RepID=UPI00135FECFC|nr:hypothetical protein [Acinetobacter baumannii]ELB1533085.1 hypothetical protein [Acinetobacter baumannii]CAA0182675.1 hypothetical protein AB901B6_00953 [Acinetobacter baumannii]
MHIKDLIQTVFLICSVVSIILFGFIYYLMVGESNASIAQIKDSLTLTASFFGGIATLATAYVAASLFNDWRHQASFELKKEHVNEICYLLALSYDELHKVKEILINLKKVNKYKILSEDFCTFIANDLRDEFYRKQLNVKILDRLNHNSNSIFSIYSIYQTHFTYLIENFSRIQESYTKYYDKFNSEISNSERTHIMNTRTFPEYVNPKEKNNVEVGLLNVHINFPVKFIGNNELYKFESIYELIERIDNIYKELENHLLDSIDLTKMKKPF